MSTEQCKSGPANSAATGMIASRVQGESTTWCVNQEIQGATEAEAWSKNVQGTNFFVSVKTNVKKEKLTLIRRESPG